MPKPAAQKKRQVTPTPADQPVFRAEGEGFILPTFAPRLRRQEKTPQGAKLFGDFPEPQGPGLSNFEAVFEGINRNLFQPLQLAIDPFAEAGGAAIEVGVEELVTQEVGGRSLSDLPFVSIAEETPEEIARLERARETLSDIRGFLPGGGGELSGPELAGRLRERFQQRPISEQIALGVSIDPLTPVVAAGPIIRGSKALRGAETAAEVTEDVAGISVTRKFVEDADSLRVLPPG